MELLKIIFDNIEKKIKKEKTNQIGPLSGSNALLWDGFRFESDSIDHCPRMALLRRVADVQPDKSITSYLSNKHGRYFEDLFRTLIDNIEFVEEEEAAVCLEDGQGNIILTARPDKILKIDNVLYPVEIKTIQSPSTAYWIFIKNKPKLNALIQVAVYMIGHNLSQGFILYAATNWFKGYAGRTAWSIQPGFKLFEVTQKEGVFYVEGKETIVTVNKIINGAYQFMEHKSNNTLPPIPDFVDIYGEYYNTSSCDFCIFKGVCNSKVSSLSEFFKIGKEVISGKLNGGEGNKSSEMDSV